MSTPFASIDAALIRLAAPTDAPAAWPDLTGESPEHVAHWRAWLTRTWSDPAVAEAIEIASRTAPPPTHPGVVALVGLARQQEHDRERSQTQRFTDLIRDLIKVRPDLAQTHRTP